MKSFTKVLVVITAFFCWQVAFCQEVLFFDDFNDNIKDYSKWTEIYTTGTWEETNQRTEFQLYESGGGERLEGIESSEFTTTLSPSAGITASCDMISNIGSTGQVGYTQLKVTDGTNWILLEYRIGKDDLEYLDSDGQYEILYGSQPDGTWNNEIQIFSDRYSATMNGYSSGWVYNSIFSTNPTLTVIISLQVGGDYPHLYHRSGFDNVLVVITGENQPPTVEITSPPEYMLHARNHPSEGLIVSGTASDPDGTLDHVSVTGNYFNMIDIDCYGQQSASWSVTIPWEYVGEDDDGTLIIAAQSFDNNLVGSEIDTIVTWVDKIVFEPPFWNNGSYAVDDRRYFQDNWDDNGSFVARTNGTIWLHPEVWSTLFNSCFLAGSIPAFPFGGTYDGNPYMLPTAGEGFRISTMGEYKVTFHLHSQGFWEYSTWDVGFPWGVMFVSGNIYTFGGINANPEWENLNAYPIIAPVVHEDRNFGSNLYELILDIIISGIPADEVIQMIKNGLFIQGLIPQSDRDAWSYSDVFEFTLSLDPGNIYYPLFQSNPVSCHMVGIGFAKGEIEAKSVIDMYDITVEFQSQPSLKNVDNEDNFDKKFISTRLATVGTIIVDNEGDGDYLYIQDAINNAIPYDTIKVYSGTYSENLSLDKPLILVGLPYELGNGSDTGAPVLDASRLSSFSGSSDGMKVIADSCSIDGFTISNSDFAGAYFNNVSYNTFSNNTFLTNKYGIVLSDYSNHNTFSDNTLIHQEYAILVINSDSNSFDYNTINENGAGIYIQLASGNELTWNTFSKNGDGIILVNSLNNQLLDNTLDTCFFQGIHVSGGDNNTISDNTFTLRGISLSETDSIPGIQTIENNSLDGKPIYYYSNMTGITVPTDAGQAILENCTDFTIQNLNISEIDNAIQLISSSDCDISLCTITECINGIVLIESDSISIINNTLTDNTIYGILISESQNIQLTGNTLTNNGISFRGDSLSSWNTHTFCNNTVNSKPIYYYADTNGVNIPNNAGQLILANCTYCNLTGAYISNVENGIQLGFSFNNSVINDTLTENLNGVLLSNADNNTFSSNTFIDNTVFGVSVHNSTANLFWGNEFTGNNTNAFEDTTSAGNFWDNGHTGNEWDDFEDNEGYPFTYEIPGPGDGADNYPFGGSVGCEYLPGDVNMALGIWPPTVIGGDVTYLVGYFIGGGQESCLLDGFWCSADINGDCVIIGGDVTALVAYFVAGGSITPCPDYESAWLEGVPDDPPAGWPNCDTPVINSKVIPTGAVK